MIKDRALCIHGLHVSSPFPFPFRDFLKPVFHSSSLPVKLSLSPSLSNTRQQHQFFKTSRIDENKITIFFVSTIRVQPYQFQVRTITFSRRKYELRFRYYSSTFYWLIFRTFQAYRKLLEVLRRLGVVRWKCLDVRTRRTTSSKFGRSFRGFFW